MVRVSPHLVGSHEMGRCSHGGGRVWSAIFKMVRASPHFSSSHGIPRDGEMFSWRGWGMVFLSLWSSGSCLGTPPPQENFSSSRGIPRDEEKWGETLAIFKIPRDGEKFSWGGRGVVKSHEEKKIPRDFSPIYANAATISDLWNEANNSNFKITLT